jgi:hypothetical protein
VIVFVRKSAEGDSFKKEPLTWALLKTDAGWSAMAVCSNGHRGALDDHVIADDGTVSPSVVCPEKGCGFHDHIQLEGWLGG